jgi:hypothetical protein
MNSVFLSRRVLGRAETIVPGRLQAPPPLTPRRLSSMETYKTLDR